MRSSAALTAWCGCISSSLPERSARSRCARPWSDSSARISHTSARGRPQIQRLDAALKALGGYRFVRSCGDPSADVEYVSILAWYTKLNVGSVGHRPQFEIFHQHKPAVLFTALYNGWVVHTYHITGAKRVICAGLNDVAYIVTPQHPGGVVVHTS